VEERNREKEVLVREIREIDRIVEEMVSMRILGASVFTILSISAI
jgi:hypothetical protein